MIKYIAILLLIPTLSFANPIKQIKEVTAKIETDSGKIGAGVVVKSDGLIITANHVVKKRWGREKFVKITLDNQIYTGVVQDDIYLEFIDLALIKIPALDLKYAKIGTWGTYKVGDDVYNMGHPLSFDFVAAKGIISQFHSKGWGQRILTDATTNSGNSGGGLFDQNGLLIGIILEVPLYKKDGITHPSGYGIAIASSDFKDLIEEYKNDK